jgi:hypothetical protein
MNFLFGSRAFTWPEAPLSVDHLVSPEEAVRIVMARQ